MANTNNTHFRNTERAPHEIADLLLALPADFMINKKHPDEIYLMADAVERHAANAKNTLLSGLEAIGTTMFAAATNENDELDRSTIADLGCLIRHIAVEVQFLSGREEECAGVQRKGESFTAKKGGAQ